MSFSVRANILAVLALSASALAAQTAPRVFSCSTPPPWPSKRPIPPSSKPRVKKPTKPSKCPPQSVTAKTVQNPALRHDKHDYMSMACQTSGPTLPRPTISPASRMAGQTNPEINDIP